MSTPQPTPLGAERAANLAENPYAGQGPVLLDIGGDVGAVILHLPAELEGAEVEYRRIDGSGDLVGPGDAHHHHEHEHEHEHEHGHGHEHEHEHHTHDHGDGRPHHHHAPHVAVVGRPVDGGVAYTAVFPDLVAGRYVLTLPDAAGDVEVDVVGGAVTEVTWPV